MGHPVRVQALTILNERVASPNEISKELGESVGHVSYHIKVLKECECIELVDTAPRRGAMEHYYRATARAFLDADEWAALPDVNSARAERQPAADCHQRRCATALNVGTLRQAQDRHLSWTPMIVDEAGLGGHHQVGLEEMLEKVFEIQADSAARLAKADAAGVPVTVAMMAFERRLGTTARVAPSKKGRANPPVPALARRRRRSSVRSACR